MSRFETTFRNAVASAERDVLLEQIRANPEMTLSELGRLTNGELGALLKNLTVGDLLTLDRSSPPARPERSSNGRGRGAAESATRPEKAEKAEKAEKTGRPLRAVPDVETRTAAGREQYDREMLVALHEGDAAMSAEELRARVGGTPLQARAALARLIEAGHVLWEGRARGTRYSVAS